MVEDELLTKIFERRSIRKFSAQNIPKKIVESILLAGQRAPTGTRLEAYSFIVISDPLIKSQIIDAILERASEREGRWREVMESAPLWVMICIDFARVKIIFNILGVDIQFGEVTKLVRGYVDATLAAENIVIASEALGLGSCFVGYPMRSPKRMWEILGLPLDVLPFLLLCIGYPDEDPNLKSRLPLEAVIHENQYVVPSEDLLREHYLKAFGSLIKAQGSWKYNFTHEATKKQEQVLRNELRELGFLY